MPTISGPTTTQLNLNNPSTKKTAHLTVTSTGSVDVSGGDAVNLSGGPWSLRLDGLIHSNSNFALLISTTRLSTVRIGKTGHLQSDSGGASFWAQSNVLFNNAGRVDGGFEILFSNSATINNSGVIDSTGATWALKFGDGRHQITNTGTITTTGYAIYAADILSVEHVINKNTITGAIKLGGDDDTVANFRTINSFIDMGAGNDSVSNSSAINSTVDMGIGNDRLVNSSAINDVVDMGAGKDSIKNSGFLNASVDMGADNDRVANSGFINAGIDMGLGNDTFTNFIKVGRHIKSGHLALAVLLGPGDDKYVGGKRADIADDGSGKDTFLLGGGNDHYRGFATGWDDAPDRVDGGAGTHDLYDLTSANVNLWINLDTKAHTLGAISVGAAPTAAQTEKESSGLNFGDKVIGFEDIHGGDTGNVIYGSAKANGLTGGAAGDNLLGEGGNDVLHGGGGADGLAGGKGKDLLFGEAGADFFQFLSVKDSSASAKSRDVIMDWESGDHIVFYFDGNTKKAGHQGFTFLASDGAAFTGHAGPNGEGEVRFFHTATQTIVQADVNHDGKADFSVAINATIGLSVTDFEFH